MIAGGGWEVVRHQVTLCGRVTAAATGEALREVDVWIGQGPPSRASVATLRPNGLYFFLDLPAGRYEVAAADRRRRRHGRGTGEVSWDAAGRARLSVVDLELARRTSTGAPSGD